MYHLYHFFFAIHLFFGYITLLSGLGAMLAKKGRMIHRYCGIVFVIAMTFIFITTIPMSIIMRMPLPFLVSVIALYFTFSGLNYARTHNRHPGRTRMVITSIMLCVGIATTCLAIYSYRLFPGSLIQIATFALGGLACTIICLADLQALYHRKQMPNSVRVTKHFTGMLAALSVSVTGFTVTKLHEFPVFFTWLGPGLIAILYIIWWRIRVTIHSEIREYIGQLPNK